MIDALPWVVAGGWFGGIVASLTLELTWRAATGLPTGPRSTCTCGTDLPLYRLVPVFSWVAARGRAGCCGRRIPLRHVLWEAFGMTTGTAAGLVGVGIGGTVGGAVGVLAAITAVGVAAWRWQTVTAAEVE